MPRQQYNTKREREKAQTRGSTESRRPHAV